MENNRLNTLFMRIDRHLQLQGKRVEAFFQDCSLMGVLMEVKITSNLSTCDNKVNFRYDD